MLQLRTQANDICRIVKILAKYNINASITNSVITLNGDISEEMLTQLCGNVNIHTVQNYIGNEQLDLFEENSFSQSEEQTTSEIQQKSQEKPKNQKNAKEHKTAILRNTSNYELIYSEVKRGEIYWCDFGEPYGSEEGFIRYAIVVQNDVTNMHSPTTIVVPCTTQLWKNKIPTQLRCCFSPQNMVDYHRKRIGSKGNVILTEQIQTVDKSRLRKYLGRLTPEFMKEIESKLDISLGLKRENVIKEKDKSLSIEKKDNPKTPQEPKNVNMAQIQLLSLVDINELMLISQNNFSKEEKVQKILELFGFDLKKNGVEYLLKAIVASPKNTYFNLETLTKSISTREGIDQEEIKRLIVARIKENFNFKKAPTIDFIRLVHSFLTQQGDNDETNI